MMARWKWWAGAAVAVLAAAWLCRAPLLGGLAGFLIVDQPADDVNWIGVIGSERGPAGDRRYEAVAELLLKRPSSQILLVELRPSRLEQIGVLPPFAELSRQHLTPLGVPGGKLARIQADGTSTWAVAHALAAWLPKHPDASLLLHYPQFRTAHLCYAIDSVLTPAEAARVRIHPLPDGRFDATDWWRSRSGFGAFGIAWLLQLQDWLGGGRDPAPPQKTADGYQRDFLRDAKGRGL
jgi:hypothetical protein